MEFHATVRNFLLQEEISFLLLRPTPAVSGNIFDWKYQLPQRKIFYPTLLIAYFSDPLQANIACFLDPFTQTISA